MKYFALILFVILLSCVAENINTTNKTKTLLQGTIVVADISDEPAKKIARLTPFINYIALRMNEAGIGKGAVKIAPDMATLISWSKKKQIDIYQDSLFKVLRIMKETQLSPLMCRWKGGSAEYWSVFFSLRKNGYRSLEDLKGKIIALEDPDSTTGFFLPVSELLKSGSPFTLVTEPGQKIDAEAIGLFMAEEDENIFEHVISGNVAAGVLGSNDFYDIKEETRSELSVLRESEKIPRQVLLVKKEITESVLKLLSQIILKMNSNSEGMEALDKMKGTSRFTNLTFPDMKQINDFKKMLDPILAIRQEAMKIMEKKD